MGYEELSYACYDPLNNEHPQHRFLRRFDKNYLSIIIKYHEICTLSLLLVASLEYCRKLFILRNTENEPRHEKTNILVSDRVRHKSGCTATGDG